MSEHWNPQRKAALLAAIDYELLSIGEVRARFALSDEELAWRRDVAAHGVLALRSTRLQIYRDPAGTPKRPGGIAAIRIAAERKDR